jgi:hypothetical protein
VIEVLLAVVLWGLGSCLAWEYITEIDERDNLEYMPYAAYAFTALWPAFAFVGVLWFFWKKVFGKDGKA